METSGREKAVCGLAPRTPVNDRTRYTERGRASRTDIPLLDAE
jgi:hypothetical protein